MKRISICQKTLFVAGCFALISAINVGVSHAASVADTASGKVIAPIAITAGTPLAFGSFAADTAGGNLAIDTAGVLTPAATIHTITSAHSAASFGVSGEGSTSFTISLPSTITLTGPAAATMTVGTFTTAMVSGATITAGVTTLPVGGTDTLLVGATAVVGASQAVGTYTGSLTAQVDYN
jgi:hypothetical protein